MAQLQAGFQMLVQVRLGLFEWNEIRKIQRFPAGDLPVWVIDPEGDEGEMLTGLR